MQLIGTVVPGKGQARTIGYPTANIAYSGAQAPDAGVWTCTVELPDETKNALAIVGMWQQPDGLPSLEVYLLDFDRDLYGAQLRVELLTKMRELKKFTDTQALVRQIERDVAAARISFTDKN